MDSLASKIHANFDFRTVNKTFSQRPWPEEVGRISQLIIQGAQEWHGVQAEQTTVGSWTLHVAFHGGSDGSTIGQQLGDVDTLFVQRRVVRAHWCSCRGGVAPGSKASPSGEVIEC